MKTTGELRRILESVPWGHINAHVHTHLCDGAAEMTVDRIAAEAERTGIGLVILTPHFHRRVADESETLYEDTDERILLMLREEIDAYQGGVRFLLSTEADILNMEGDLSLNISREAERALDLTTPTLNYHPLLPLRAVHLTYGRDIDGMHESGEYERMARAAGGIEAVLEGYYTAQANAVKRAPYPAMLGHFFAAHSIANERYSWFGMQKEHLPIMRAGAERVTAACKAANAMVDVTGIHLTRGETPAHKREKDAFLGEFQQWFLTGCAAGDIPTYPGSDAHSLEGIKDSLIYKTIWTKGETA